MADVRAALPLPYRAIPCSQMFSVIDPKCYWDIPRMSLVVAMCCNRCVSAISLMTLQPFQQEVSERMYEKMFEQHLLINLITWMVHTYGKLVGKIYQSHGSTLTPSTVCCFHDHCTTQYQGLRRWCLDGGAVFFCSILVGHLKKIPIPFFGRMGRFIYLKEWLVIILLRWWFQSNSFLE